VGTQVAPPAGSWEGIRFGPRRLAHGNFFVRDVEASLDFYQRVCGLTLVFREPGIQAVFLSNGNSHHDVALMGISTEARIGRDGQVQVPRGRGTEPGLNHLGFEMATEAELVGAYQRAVAAGLPLHRTADHQIAHSVYLFDPEGNYLEMYADATRDWRGIYRAVGDQLLTGIWDPEAAPPNTKPLFNPDPDYARVEAAMLHPIRTSRATFAVRDLPWAAGFYTEVVGLHLVAGGGDVGWAVLGGELGGPDIALIQAGGDIEPGLHHFGLQLGEDELAEARQRLAQHGVPVLLQIDTAAKRSIVIADPDGMRLEFFVPGSDGGSVTYEGPGEGPEGAYVI
jgi:catechol 2,3-dioxygenase